ncbi:MAG: hypothetical protein ACRCZF_13375 [Gemmataceae bacterium]
MAMVRAFSRRLAGLGLVTGLFSLTVGCGGGLQYAEVSGKVMHKGKPVSAGMVYIVSATDPNHTGGGMLSGDGTFSGSVPLGKIKVAIQTGAFKPGGTAPGSTPPGGGPPRPGGSPPSGGPPKGSSGPAPAATAPSMNAALKTGNGAAGGGGGAPKYVPIPEKYERIDTSGLEYEMKNGKNELTIDLP